ncbi:uncharacterized protein RHOBADRAFT_39255 [Rhodotorula graminis WP1]|uniref:ABC transporter domain-containing protein n=1 Tax=Rhodotorula graminis (strain WP1) TaxID=578459 RepID=A0A0P9ETX9_RHOGW|nr:uncharacterized protein RHOBADRAFT_39255 [Rhodotorula graminis WP1]KPV72649.1 hypothetical protein RHOBADRAFT_39255 [Rhodotorula graminis WP1]
MLPRALAVAVAVALVGPVLAQLSCSNYGVALPNGTCQCPSGLSPSTACTAPTCDNPLVPPDNRQLFSAVLSGNSTAGCGRQCSDGFEGPTCGVCTSDSACSTALQALNGAASSSSSGLTLTNGLGNPVCSRGPWTWTEGFGTCDVVNPTLQSAFAGSTFLTFSKTVEPSETLSIPFGANGTLTAQLWYAPSTGNTTLAEQFYCAASSCTQANSSSTTASDVDYTCATLACTCIPGTAFCGAPGAQIDLSSTINDLEGPLSITCDSATGAQCSFKQGVLQTLFGASGLGLSACRWGECVLPGTIDRLAASLAGSAASSSGGGDGPSGGVIAGLAVLGALVVALVALVGLGCASQRRARCRARARAPDSAPPVGISINHLSYFVPVRHSAFSLKSASRDDRQVLSDVSATVVGGSFCAILGPSGSGKTSLVDLVAGVRKTGYRTGAVDLVVSPRAHGPASGEEGLGATASDADRVRVGYVDQNDVLCETSTVREAVMFAAELKLGEIPQEQKRCRVFEVLKQLGLLDIADSEIGSPEAGGRRGISGGERRRVSIALELVAQPAVLILDEPTSGASLRLDSTSALRILRELKALTTPPAPQRPTTVLVTLHQPSSQLWHLFDDTLVLAQGGAQLYFGKAHDVSAWWEAKGLRCPEGWNPADFLLDLATSPPPDFLPLRPTLTTRKSSYMPVSPDVAAESALVDSAVLAIPPHRRRSSATTVLTQVEVLAKREARNLVRDRGALVMHLVVLPLVALFVGGMYYKVDLTIGGFQSRIGALFFSGCLVAFASLSALSQFAKARRLFIRERARACYHPLAWLAAQFVFDVVPLRLVPTILLSVIVYWMVGLAATAANFFKFVLVLVLFALVSTVWNQLLATVIDDVGSAILVSAVVVLFEMAFAGFFVNLGSIPPVLRWLEWLAPLKYTLEALAVNEVNAGLMIEDSLAGAKVSISATIIMDTLFGFRPDAYYRDVLVLVGFLLGFALLLTLFVLLRLRELR